MSALWLQSHGTGNAGVSEAGRQQNHDDGVCEQMILSGTWHLQHQMRGIIAFLVLAPQWLAL